MYVYILVFCSHTNVNKKCLKKKKKKWIKWKKKLNGKKIENLKKK